ncbi:putative von Willebrand factor (vWF) type A domain contatining protein [Lyophyllum shimeji]|uniref:von Willebrand factor (VWF) type A domain contatining protein n=1 Tax=Lyophyllum shimeji TaxID=47721 RepID=A0A9P3UK77_LYOSH|nr:putative von Willebrand factor (vWF) type A domain contatining protein [Lyophyllum shimeji]
MGNSSSSQSKNRGKSRSAHASTSGARPSNLLLPPQTSLGHRRTRSAAMRPSRREETPPPPPYRARDDSAISTPVPHTSSGITGYGAALSERALYLRRPMRRETEEDALETLRKYNTILIVDDSSSMRGARWEEAGAALSGLASRAGEYDTDGIDIHFLNSPEIGQDLKDPRAVRDLFNRVQPRGPTPIGAKLEELLQDYMYQIETASKGDPRNLRQIKPINYIILTDGAPTDDPESVIVQTAKRLDAGNFPIHQVGIQFVQIGDSKSATSYLNDLDDELADKYKIRDIVDTTPFNDIGGELNPDILIKILLGGINRRVDKSGATVLQAD